MNEQLRKELSVHAANIRMGALEGIYSASSGHPGGSLSCADILTYLYFVQLNIDPNDPKIQTETDLFYRRDMPRRHFTLHLRKEAIFPRIC